MKFYALSAFTALLLAANSEAAGVKDRPVRSRAPQLTNSPAQRNGKKKSFRNWAAVRSKVANTTGILGQLQPPVNITGPKKGVTYAGSQWLGLDGTTDCSDNFLSVGVNWQTLNNKTTYDTFYQWYPNPQHPIPGWNPDLNRLLTGGYQFIVQANSKTSATVSITYGFSTDGPVYSFDLKDQPPLCLQTCEFVLEDPSYVGHPGLVAFTNQWAGYPGWMSGEYNSTVQVDSDLFELVQNGKTLVEVSHGYNSMGSVVGFFPPGK